MISHHPQFDMLYKQEYSRLNYAFMAVVQDSLHNTEYSRVL